MKLLIEKLLYIKLVCRLKKKIYKNNVGRLKKKYIKIMF